jgi:hypothetical protein
MSFAILYTTEIEGAKDLTQAFSLEVFGKHQRVLGEK